jgi:hypothetical protein
LRLAAESFAASGMPLLSTTTWRFVPGLPRCVGFGPVSSPPLFAGTLALSKAALAPVDLVGFAQEVEQFMADALPDARLMPFF